MPKDNYIDPKIIARVKRLDELLRGRILVYATNQNGSDAETDVAVAGLPREHRYPHDRSQIKRLEDWRANVDRLEHAASVTHNEAFTHPLSRQLDELAAAISEHDPRGRTVGEILAQVEPRTVTAADLAILVNYGQRRAIGFWVQEARDAVAELEDTGADCGPVRHALAMIVDTVSPDAAPDVGLYWTSADGSGTLPIGRYTSLDAATAAIPAATAELLAKCATDQERANIRAGRWTTRTASAGIDRTFSLIDKWRKSEEAH